MGESDIVPFNNRVADLSQVVSGPAISDGGEVGRREKVEGRKEKGEGRREKGEGRREKKGEDFSKGNTPIRWHPCLVQTCVVITHLNIAGSPLLGWKTLQR